MVWVKRCILLGLSPLTVSLLLLVAGVLCLWSGRRPKLGRVLCVSGLVLLTWAGFGGSARAYLARLEGRHAPLDLAAQPAATVARWRYVLVLGAGHVSDPRLPVTSQIGAASLYRLVEGIRLHRQLPGSRLILTGGPGLDVVPNAEVVAAVARELGVAQEDLIVLGQPRDTREEAAAVRAIVGSDPFVLVHLGGAHAARPARIRGAGTAPRVGADRVLLRHRPAPRSVHAIPDVLGAGQYRAGVLRGYGHAAGSRAALVAAAAPVSSHATPIAANGVLYVMTRKQLFTLLPPLTCR